MRLGELNNGAAGKANFCRISFLNHAARQYPGSGTLKKISGH